MPILRVEPNSAAAKAGLQGAKRNSWGQISLGDVIVAIEDYPVTNDDQLLSALEHYKPGDKVNVSVVRDGKLLTRNVVANEYVPAPPEGYRLVKFASSYASGASQVESVSLAWEDGAWRVVGIVIG